MNACICDPELTATRPAAAQEIWRRYHQQADAEAENALVERYLPLVSAAVGRLAMTLPDHVDHDDLYSAGLVGLLQAIRNYNPACGTSFETYARVRIRGAMLDELRRMDWVPRTVHEKARRVQHVMIELEQRNGRAPTEAEMANALNLSGAEYAKLVDEIRPAAFVCLDAVHPGEDGDLHDIIGDAAEEGPDDLAARQELKQLVFDRLKALPEMQRKVLALYYIEDMRLKEIAEAFGVTESRICQIHSQAILSIRAYVQRFESGMAQKLSGGKS